MRASQKKDFIAGDRLGPFRIEKRVSDDGGMAVVYRAVVDDRDHPAIQGKRVALKVARGEEHAQIYEALLTRETRSLQLMRHPGIVRIFPFSHRGRIYPDNWFGRTDAPHFFYFAMEFLEGQSLAQLIRSGELRAYSMSWRVELLYQIACAIDYLHIRGVVHRDLKPENIMFRYKPQPDQIPQPVLIDFGLSEKRQLRGVNVLTIAYAPPEAIYDMRASSPTDLMLNNSINKGESEATFLRKGMAFDMWSFGAVAFEVLNGTYPFGGLTGAITVVQDNILRGQIAPMSVKISPGMISILQELLDRNWMTRLTIDKFLQRLETTSGLVSPRL
ncbi:MAG: serine/threonine-protein kinase [bacterium]|nr:serine/threonine-protein kinase [bacterium]